MNSNVVVTLDTRRKKKDGTYPVVMRLGHNERTTSIPLNVSLLEKDWDAKARQVKKSHVGVSSVSRLNNLIQKRKADAMDIILQLNESGKLAAMHLTELKDRLIQDDSTHSFFAFAEGLIVELIAAHRIGTARSYNGVVSVLKGYCGMRDLKFQDITYAFLTKFEAQHFGKGNTTNGLAVYMRTIRAIYNKAIKSGFVDKQQYPFAGYTIKTAPTEKRALDWNLLKKVMTLKIEPIHECFNARNYFVASYMMYGMNYTDMAHLQKTDIADGRIKYRRRKTGKLYDIKITSALEEILTYYIVLSPNSPFIFPIIKRETPLLQDKDIQWSRKRYDKKLKVLAGLCGIDQTLTSYVSRHSFATQAMLQQVPLNAISSMLGHSSLKTTEVYLKSLPSNILDDYNDRILQNS